MLGSLCGGLYWRLALFDATDFESDDAARAVSGRWRRVGGLAVAGLGGVGSVATGAVDRPLDAGELAVGVGVALAPLLWVALGRYTEDERYEPTTPHRWLFFAVVLGSLLGFS